MHKNLFHTGNHGPTSALDWHYIFLTSNTLITKKHMVKHACQKMSEITANQTRHRASTSMYSLTFCVRVMSPERHHWKPTVQATAVMFRTPPVDGQSPASQPCHFPYTARNFENAPVTRRSPASSARTPRRAFALCRHIAGWMQTCN